MTWELAKAVEAAVKQEVPSRSTSIMIKPRYWDSLKEGLLAGELLALDIRRMEAEYLRTNQRELEITKHISVGQLDPLALVKLRESGSCEFMIPEVLFDLDYPGHYLRRIKTVSVSIPCVVGPYSGVPGTLTLNESWTRKPDGTGGYVMDRDQFPPASIAISTGQADSGLFETNLRDERYLPFENRGIVNSRWELRLGSTFKPFDYGTISDVVLHVRYTAQNDEGFAGQVAAGLRDALNAVVAFGESTGGLWRVFSLRHDFPATWHQLRAGASGDTTIEVARNHFGALLRESTLKLDCVRAFALLPEPPASTDSLKLELTRTTAQSPSASVDMANPFEDLANVLYGEDTIEEPITIAEQGVKFRADLDGTIDRGTLRDVAVAVRFQVLSTAG